MNYNKEEALSYYKEVADIRKELLQRVEDEKRMDMPKDTVAYEKYSNKNKKLMERNLTIDKKMEEVFLSLPDNSGYITHIATIDVGCLSALEHTVMKNFLESKGFLSNEYKATGNGSFSTSVGSDSSEGLNNIIKEVSNFASKFYLKANVNSLESRQEASNTMMNCMSPILLGSKVNEILYFPLKENSSATHNFSKLSKLLTTDKDLYRVQEFEFKTKEPNNSSFKAIMENLKSLPKVFEDLDEIKNREHVLKVLKNDLYKKTGIKEDVDYNQYNIDGRKALRERAIEMEIDRFKNLIETKPEIEPKAPSAIQKFLNGIKNRVEVAKDLYNNADDLAALKKAIEEKQNFIFELTGLTVDIDLKQHKTETVNVDGIKKCFELELKRFTKITNELLNIPNIVEDVCERPALANSLEKMEEKTNILKNNGVKLK